MNQEDTMAEKRALTAQEELIERGKQAKAEHAARHGDDSPTSAAATAEEAAELGKALGFGTYAADESADAPAAKAVERSPENKAQAAPEKK